MAGATHDHTGEMTWHKKQLLLLYAFICFMMAGACPLIIKCKTYQVPMPQTAVCDLVTLS